MVAINFQARFADDVEYGAKCQTIRAKARCKPGDSLQLYTGMRTKECRKLRDATCQSVTPIRICSTEMFIDGRRLYAGNALRGDVEDHDNDFAKKDGFSGFMEMADWFAQTHGPLPFDGFLIKWRP